MNLKILCWVKKPDEKKTYFMIPFMNTSWKWQLIYSAREHISDWVHAGEGRREGSQRGTRKLLVVMDTSTFTILIVVMGSLLYLFQSVHFMWSSLHANYISIKLFNKIGIYSRTETTYKGTVETDFCHPENLHTRIFSPWDRGPQSFHMHDKYVRRHMKFSLWII